MAKTEQRGFEVPTFDTRLLEQNLRNGKITKREYDAYLNKLEDSASNAVYIEFEDDATIETDPTNATTEDLTFT